MDCHFRNMLDLCSEPECFNSVITPKHLPGLEAPHTPNHGMLKVHRVFFNRDVARVERSAKEALEAARTTISDLEAEKQPFPGCVCCRSAVSLPCWYCVDCASESPQTPLSRPAQGRFSCR